MTETRGNTIIYIAVTVIWSQDYVIITCGEKCLIRLTRVTIQGEMGLREDGIRHSYEATGKVR